MSGSLIIPGSCEGAAHLFDLSGKRYGGVVWRATSSQKVKVMNGLRTRESVTIELDPQISLDSDLSVEARCAVAKAVGEAVPGSGL